ncbi:MAG: TonB family protein [Woeseiaceae bacterium]|nr:TonB family protein [Woeseiaceae bacterium]
MTDAKDNSSLPLLLGITGSILLVAVGGWFFLEQGDEPVATATPPPPAAAQSSVPQEPATDVDVQEADEPAETAPEATPAIEVVDAPTTGIDAELRKARLAAEADILVVPAAQSALYYYGRILDAEPDNEIANAELDAVLARVAQSVATLLAAEEFAQAYEIAVQVARRRPEHALVAQTQEALDSHTEDLVQQALELVRAGNDDDARQALADAESLPGRNPEYFAAVRDSIDEIRDAREVAEERDRQRRAVNNARTAWVQSVRGAIGRGDLITPEGRSARDLLAQSNNWNAERDELREELLVAMVDGARADIEAELLEDAATLIDAATRLGAEAGDIAQLQAALETATIQKQSNSVVPLSELVLVKRTSPVFPRRASRTNVSGYVDLIFTVTPAGETSEISVHRAEPESIFDAAAIRAVEQWEFEPVEYRGQIISQRTGARLIFRLE